MGTAEKFLMVALWLLTLLCSLVGAFLLFEALGAEAAPAQAAAAAVACGFAVIPYVFTRAVEGIFQPGGRS